MLLTIKELAEHLQVDYPTCYGLVKFLVEKDLIILNTKKDGKKSSIYEVPNRIIINVPVGTPHTPEDLVHSYNSTHHMNLHHVDCPLCKEEVGESPTPPKNM